MIDEIVRWIKSKELICEGDYVIAGVSGGADSVCLLLILLELQKKMMFSIQVVHVEHGIREQESRRDADFVEALCSRKKVPCDICHVDVPAFASEQRLGIEEAARIKRYECFEKAVLRQKESFSEVKVVPEPAIKVALAHHADDNAETVLFQMIRGSGVDGLGGMRASRPFAGAAQIIRPLLTVSRTQIEEYLNDVKEPFCVDKTNLDTDYSRNRLRHIVIPQLTEINSQAVSHMNKSALLLQQVADYLREQEALAAADCCDWQENGCLIKEQFFLRFPQIIQTGVVHQVLGKLAGSSKDLGMIHVETVMSLFLLQVGRKQILPYQMQAKRVYDGIFLTRENMDKVSDRGETEKAGDCFTVTAEQQNRLEAGETVCIILPDGEIKLRVFDCAKEDFSVKNKQNLKKKYTKWLDYDKIKCGLQIRRRRMGDYLTVDEQGHTKKLKEYFINEKIAQVMRDKIWLLAEQSQIIWVIGRRIGAAYKIKESTKRILEVQIVGGTYHENQED